MKYTIKDNTIVFDSPLRKYKNGIKIIYYRNPDTEREKSDYPVAYGNTESNQRSVELPHDVIELLEVLVKQPKYKLFPFIWHDWVVAKKY